MTDAPQLVAERTELDGETLDRRLARNGFLDVAELAELVRQACSGVHAAREAGIAQRDLTPENLLVTTKDGRPFMKLLGLGASKHDEDRPGASAVPAQGAALEARFYLPPEQVGGDKTTDARADVYAFGVILYECACGERPFVAHTLPRLAALIQEGNARPLEARRPELPRAFVEVVRKAMAVRREDRFASAGELGEALEHFAAARAIGELDAVSPVAPAPASAPPLPALAPVSARPAPALAPASARPAPAVAPASARPAPLAVAPIAPSPLPPRSGEPIAARRAVLAEPPAPPVQEGIAVWKVVVFLVVAIGILAYMLSGPSPEAARSSPEPRALPSAPAERIEASAPPATASSATSAPAPPPVTTPAPARTSAQPPPASAPAKRSPPARAEDAAPVNHL